MILCGGKKSRMKGSVTTSTPLLTTSAVSTLPHHVTHSLSLDFWSWTPFPTCLCTSCHFLIAPHLHIVTGLYLYSPCFTVWFWCLVIFHEFLYVDYIPVWTFWFCLCITCVFPIIPYSVIPVKNKRTPRHYSRPHQHHYHATEHHCIMFHVPLSLWIPLLSWSTFCAPNLPLVTPSPPSTISSPMAIPSRYSVSV